VTLRTSHRRCARRIGCLAAAGLLLGVAASQPVRAEDDAVARLRAVADAHSDDPDLQWALAMAEAEADPAAAADRLDAYAARWPDRRSGVWLEIGRLRSAASQDVLALAAYDRALEEDPGSGTVELHRGLALRRLGRLDEANVAFAQAAELEPALAQESLLLRGSDELTAGRADAAVVLLEKAVQVDPSTEGARRARLLLPQAAPPPVPGLLGGRLGLFAVGGVEYDTNVTLDNELGLQSGSDDRDDVSGVWSAGGTFRAYQGERTAVTLGYRYDGSAHTDLLAYDAQGQLGVASLAYRAFERVTLRLDGTFSYLRLGGSSYGHTRALRPAVFFSLGDEIGTTSVYGTWERSSYDDEPSLSSLDQDGRWYSLGVDHTIEVPGLEGTFVTVGGRWATLDTGSSDDLFGFDSAYDHDRWSAGFAVSAPLPWQVSLGLAGRVGFEGYENVNLVDFLTGDGGDLDLSPERRHDRVFEYGVTLSRPIRSGLFVDLSWRATNRHSNVDLYTYDRNVVGLALRFQTE